ncbi:hypothetical protein ES332_A11G062600v1 [Gossypium tomentosum]|uniref:Major facilitator superfamily (MFS) profile domain-containing protein n=1 Tax=Gossypium tomentosum TaxID=34277 RepID=A0A5D2N7T0_GOSTO|nr:hypothetical protein ES332_A11G062600v1 [Gossypium tomentosum]
MKSETLTLVLVNLAGIMERADESLLPGVYKEVGAALHTDPTGLGSLTVYRSIVQSSCYPLAAYLAMHHNRAHVIALGAFLWAAATFLVAISTTFLQVALSRGLNGIGLAIVIPAIQSLVADSTDDSNRGMAFGWLQLTGNIGSILGGLCSVLIASKTIIGIPGWRFAFHLVGIISVVVGILVCFFTNDPRYSDRDNVAKDHAACKSFSLRVKDMINEAKSVMRIPTFQVIVAQGVSGSFAGSALAFAPMWLELIGFSHETTALIMTLFVISGSIGAAVLMLALPDNPSTAVAHGLVFSILGLWMSWNAPATNNPIFAEIVPEKSRTSIYALDNSFESILASFAPPIVGILAQLVFGYKPIPEGSSDSIEIETDRENAASLAKALYTAIGIPMAIYRETARMQALIDSELQDTEENYSLSSCGKPGFHVVNSKKLDDEERSESYIEFGGEKRLDFENNDDKKSLLHHDQ